jgi:HlyD family secretion protein
MSEQVRQNTALDRMISTLAAAFAALATLLAGCSGEKSSAYQGYVEGEYVNVASPVAGRLDKLLVLRGQTVEAKAPLFRLEAEQELAAKQQADEPRNAAEAQLADLKVGRRRPEVAVTRRSSRRRGGRDTALQLRRDEAQFDAGGTPR